MSKRRAYGRRERCLVVLIYRATGSIREAAAAAKVGRTWAYKVLKAEDVATKTVPVFRMGIVSEALALYSRGASARGVVAELAKTHDPAPSREWVLQRAREAGILRSQARANELAKAQQLNRDFDAIRRRAFALATEHLWSVKRIAEHLGVSRNTIERAIPREFRLDRSESRRRRIWQAYLPDVEERRAKHARVLQMRTAGALYREIAAETQLTLSTIMRWLSAAGLTKARSKVTQGGLCK